MSFTLCIAFLAFFGCANKEVGPEELVPISIETEITLETSTATIYGTLTLPDADGQFPVVLIIAGSGPTDKNGNNTMGLLTNSYKMISDTLAFHGIASVRYDKRGVGKSYYKGLEEADLTFEHYISDAENWISKLKSDTRFVKVLILGHSEGALIGSIISKQLTVDGFISVAGTSQKASALLLEQLSAQPEDIKSEASTIIDSLNKGVPVANVSPALFSLFRPSVQPFLISWFKYDPKTEIAKISSRILILHGNRDIQVKSAEAAILAQHNPNSEFVIIDNMNHVLKDASGDYQENIATYSNPNLPLSTSFTVSLLDFIEKIGK